MADKKISALTGATTPLAGTEVLPIVQSGSTVKVSVANLTAGRQVSASELAVGVATPTAGYKTDLRGRTRIGGADGYLFDIQSSASNGTTLQAYLDNGEIAVVQGGTAAVPVNFFVAGSKRFELLTAGDAKLSTGNLIQGTAAKGVNFTANTAAAGMTSQLLNWYEEGTWTPSVGGNATYTRQQGYYTRIGRQVTIQCDMIINVLGTGSGKYITGAPFSSGSIFYAGSVSYWSSLNNNYYYITPMISGTQVQFNTISVAGPSSAINDSTTIFQDGSRVIFTLTYFV